MTERVVPRETADAIAVALIALARAVIATDPPARRAKLTVVEGGMRGGRSA